MVDRPPFASLGSLKRRASGKTTTWNTIYEKQTDPVCPLTKRSFKKLLLKTKGNAVYISHVGSPATPTPRCWADVKPYLSQLICAMVPPVSQKYKRLPHATVSFIV